MAENISIDDKIKLATSLCNRDVRKFNQFNYVYPFTTENISGYIDKFDLKGKNLLTLGSSGDQALNAILRGCKDITAYDICPFAKEYFYLKKAAIMCLSREDYLRFLCYKGYPMWPIKNWNVFSHKTFDRIYERLVWLDIESSYFWSELLANFSGIEVRRNMFINIDERRSKVIQCMNRYLISDEAFNALRDKINSANVEFITGNILDIALGKKYDNINLSNVAAYMDTDMLKKVFFACTDLLKEDGKMLVSYLYDTDFDDQLLSDESTLYNIKKIRELLSPEIRFDMFIGGNGLAADDMRMTDGILTYKKVKKI